MNDERKDWTQHLLNSLAGELKRVVGVKNQLSHANWRQFGQRSSKDAFDSFVLSDYINCVAIIHII